MRFYWLQANEYITELDLSDNNIGEVGAGYIGRAQAINNSLDKVDLSGNCIRCSGAVLIGKSIMVRILYAYSSFKLNDEYIARRNCSAVRNVN